MKKQYAHNSGYALPAVLILSTALLIMDLGQPRNRQYDRHRRPRTAGYAYTRAALSPSAVISNSPASSVEQRTAVLTSDNLAYSMGANVWGQLGDFTVTDRSSPTLMLLVRPPTNKFAF